MSTKRVPQSPQVELNLQAATPETALAAARAADPNKSQKYLPILIPVRRSGVIASVMKSDHIRLFGVDADGPGGEAASRPFYTRKASKREDFTSVDDSSGESTQVGAYLVAKGSTSGLPRGKVIIVPTGITTTGTKAGRFAYIRVPSRLHAVEVANWIKTCFKGKEVKSFRLGRSEYSVDALAALIGQLPAYKQRTP